VTDIASHEDHGAGDGQADILSRAGEPMPRGRGVQKGSVYAQGPSWFVRFYEYDAEGGKQQKAERVGPAEGRDRLTKREAIQKAKEEFLDQVNRRNMRPSSSMLVADFVELKFVPQVVEKKKKAGKNHYRYLLKAFVLPAIGQMKLHDVSMDHVERMLAQMRHEGYSHQTSLHAKNAISAVFRHARRLKLYLDENPARDIDMGERPVARKRETYTWEQAQLVVRYLPTPIREMALLSLATSMNVAEMCGVRRRCCNFTSEPIMVDGEMLAPYSIAVRENYYRNEYGSLKKGSRCRNVPITPELAARLQALCQGPDHELQLFSSRNDTPLDAHNIAARTFKPLEKKLGFPVTWHAFRRAHSGFAGQLSDIPVEDRVATLGHTDARMSLYYSVADLERRRKIPAEILSRIDPGEETVQ
jgi:integrase